MDKSPLESERRQATILFADISGFTSMSEKIDPEEITAIMDDCFRMLGSIVAGNGGVIDKFIGDCVMALFGAPKALEHAPRKAIETGLKMLDEIEKLNSKWNLAKPLGLHIGINTGEVLSGELGSDSKRDFTVMGDAVNLASRLKDMAETGHIWVGPQTWRNARDAFRFLPLKPVSVKGKEEPVQVYKVVGAIAGEESKSSERMIQSPLVGRDAELARLEKSARELKEGCGSVLCLVGEAGIGKSRLCAEFYAGDAAKGIAVLEGRTLAVGQRLSYYPVIMILKVWAGIGEDDGEDAAFAKIETAVRATLPGGAEEIVPYIATLMGYRLKGRYEGRLEGVKGDSLGKLIVKNLKDLVIGAAAIRPILFVFEDLHWADESTLDLLRALVGLCERHRVMFLYAWRPGYEDTTEKFRAFLAEALPGKVETIELTALEERESGELARNLLMSAGVPDRIIGKIIEKSGGNPFFIEEVIRSFIDRGLLRPRKEGMEVSREIESTEIPDSIDEVIMSRVDRLAEAQKELLRTASVIGRSFFFSILAKIEADAESLGERIEELKELQLIRERFRLDELEYLFKHVLVQETIYRSMLLRTRKQLHLAVAAAIEERFHERLPEFYGMLAYHYSQGEDLDKAEEYLENAGKAALESAASMEALSYLQRAMELYRQKAGDAASPARLAHFERIIGRAFHNKGLYAEAIEHYENALLHRGIKRTGAAAKALEAVAGFLDILKYLYFPSSRSRVAPSEDDLELARLMVDRGWAYSSVNSTEFFHSGLAAIHCILARDAKKMPARISIFCDFSATFLVTGISLALSMKILSVTKSQATSESDLLMVDDAEQWQHLLYGIGNCVYETGHVGFLINQGEFPRLDIYIVFWGIRYVCQGRFEEAGKLAEKASEIADAYGNEGSHFKALEIQVLIDHAKRNESTSLSNERELISFSEQKAGGTIRKIFLAYLVDAHLANNDLQAAALSIGEIESLLAEEKILMSLQALPPLMSLLSFYSACYAKEGDQHRKEDFKGRAIDAIRRIRTHGPKFVFRYPEALRLTGSFHKLIGKPSLALRDWQKGLEVGSKLGTKPELGRLCFEVAKLLASPESKTKTMNKLPTDYYAKKARDLFTELGLEVDLKELNEWESGRSDA